MKNGYEVGSKEVTIWLAGRFGSCRTTTIDLEDLDKVKAVSGYWTCNADGYVIGYLDGECVRMHRLIMGVHKDVDKVVKRQYYNKLDNRKARLKVVVMSKDKRSSGATVGDDGGCKFNKAGE